MDRKLLEPRLPPRIFYNLMLAARKPEREHAAPSTRPARSTCCATSARSSTRALGPVAFVAVYAIFGLNTAAIVAIGISVVLMIERLIRAQVRGQRASAALLGTGLAAFIAVRTGKAEAFFVPRMLIQLGYARGLRRLGGDPAARSRASSSPRSTAPTRAGGSCRRSGAR